MAEWISSNWVNVVILLALAAACFLIVRSMIRGKKEGKCSCGGNCAGCSLSGCCHKSK